MIASREKGRTKRSQKRKEISVPVVIGRERERTRLSGLPVAQRAKSRRASPVRPESPATRRQRRERRRKRSRRRRRRCRRCRRRGDGSESCHFDRHFSAEERLCGIRTSPRRGRCVPTTDDAPRGAAPQRMRLAWPVSPSRLAARLAGLAGALRPFSPFRPPSGTRNARQSRDACPSR